MSFKINTTLKRTISLVLLLINLLLAGGYSIIYKIQQLRVRSEMLEELKEGQAVATKLTLSISDFQKSKINSSEIYFKGKMYDVKSVNISTDMVELLVINDTKEEKIIEKNNELSKNANGQNKLPSQLLKLITMVYIFPVPNYQCLIQKRQNHFLLSLETLVSYKTEITSPPPKFS